MNECSTISKPKPVTQKPNNQRSRNQSLPFRNNVQTQPNRTVALEDEGSNVPQVGVKASTGETWTGTQDKNRGGDV